MLGSPCDVAGAYPPGHRGGPLFDGFECGGGAVCAYVDGVEIPDQSCTQDSDCRGATGDDPFLCVDGRCALDFRHVSERSRCATPCSNDHDCEDVADDSTCPTDYVCQVVDIEHPTKRCVCWADLGFDLL